MYADTGLMYPYFSLEIQPFDEFCGFQKPNVQMGNLIPTSTISDYDLGGEGDLFKAPEPIIEEPMISFDPMTAAFSMVSCGEDVVSPDNIKPADAFSMISCGEDVISPENIKPVDAGMVQSKALLNEVFYECEKDLLANSAMADPFPGVSDVKIPAVQMEGTPALEKDKLIPPGSIQKSVSSGCLSSMEWIPPPGSAVRPNFLDFHGVDFGAAYGMRRAFSEGDMQTLTSGSSNIMHSSGERAVTIGNYTVEERLRMLSRYRKKKTKRNFGRTIKYACRKALADSQPRVRGRFAKTEESEIPKK